ncbi:MAG: YggS family pyridoxal phosphate-dependent enzyme [Actinobacteria bacterium HGW-Actinobacteria-4]|nr:MAG: YggS family pyridoxal phosphate-dependent enzyme [Actinobacteria bacterium HGW-Actinobacteria-4]
MDLLPTPPGWDYAERLAEVRERADAACAAAGRNTGEVQLLVATKNFDADAAVAVVKAGGLLIGESTAQEIAVKADPVRAAGAHMHFIGHLQRNKANYVIDLVDCVESVATIELAERLDRVAAMRERTLDVMVQVNVSGEETKGGFALWEAADAAAQVAALEHLTVTGFMTIGANSRNEAEVRDGYSALRDLRDTVKLWGGADLARAHHLSMGMSSDLEWAIAEGATIVRVGSAIMGERTQA